MANNVLSKKLTLLGTVSKNKPDTPPELKLISRPVESSIFAFTKDLAIVSYISKNNKMVHVIASQHDDHAICQTTKINHI